MQQKWIIVFVIIACLLCLYWTKYSQNDQANVGSNPSFLSKITNSRGTYMKPLSQEPFAPLDDSQFNIIHRNLCWELFDKDLFNIILDSQTKSVAYSGFGLASMLALAYMGSSDRLERLLKKKIFLVSKEETLGYFNTVYKVYRECKGLIIDCSVWVNIRNAIPHPKFIRQVKVLGQYFGVNFNHVNLQKMIDQWAKTSIKINPQTAPDALIVNTLYFHGHWKQPFKAHNTLPDTFYVTPQIPKKVKMMNQILEDVEYFENEGFQMLKLDYIEPYSIIFVLSKRSMIETFDRNELQSYMQIMDKLEIDVKLPKFTIESELILNNNLLQIELPELFAPNYRDMTNNPNLHVSNIIQKCKIEINEEGTRAMNLSTIYANKSIKEKIEFIANKPFSFFIVSCKLGNIVLEGYYNGI